MKDHYTIRVNSGMAVSRYYFRDEHAAKAFGYCAAQSYSVTEVSFFDRDTDPFDEHNPDKGEKLKERT